MQLGRIRKIKAAENEERIADKRDGEQKKKKNIKRGVLMKEDGIREMDEEEV